MRMLMFIPVVLFMSGAPSSQAQTAGMTTASVQKEAEQTPLLDGRNAGGLTGDEDEVDASLFLKLLAMEPLMRFTLRQGEEPKDGLRTGAEASSAPPHGTLRKARRPLRRFVSAAVRESPSS